MKAFIKRNAVVFIIGVGILVVFVVSLVISEFRSPAKLPELTKVEAPADPGITLEEQAEIILEEAQNIQDDQTPPKTDAELNEIRNRIETNPNSFTDEEIRELMNGTTEEQLLASEIMKAATYETDFAQIDQYYGPVIIEFTDTGFVPKQANAYTNQLVIWVNNTDQEIILSQLLDVFDDWKNSDKVIAPGEAFEYRLINPKYLWTYKELTTNQYGSINIITAIKGFSYPEYLDQNDPNSEP